MRKREHLKYYWNTDNVKWTLFYTYLISTFYDKSHYGSLLKIHGVKMHGIIITKL